MERFRLHNAERAVNCPGSLQLTPRVTLEVNPDRLAKQREGKAADWVIMRLLANQSVTAGTETPWGVADDDMLEHCAGYVQHIRDTLAADGIDPANGSNICAEYDVDLSWLTDDRKDIDPVKGRADFRLHDGRTLYLWDFKYGRTPVEAVGNAQLAGAALDGSSRRCTDTVKAFIYQPRDYRGGGPVKSWEFDADEIKRQAQRFRIAVVNSVKPDAPLNVGPWCSTCDAAGLCPAMQEYIDMAKTVLDAPSSMTPEEVGARLATATELQNRSKDLVSVLTSQGMHYVLNQNKHVPGFKVVRGVTKRKIKDPEQLIAIAPLYGLSDDDVTDRKPKSLKALEKAFGVESINEFTEKPPGKLELAPETDKREAAVNNNAAAVFAAPPKMPGA